MTISFSISERSEALRNEIRTWLKANPPPRVSIEENLDLFVRDSRAWQKKLAENRFVGAFFPEEYGGRGVGLVEESIFQEELAKCGSPQLVGLFGLTMVGPVLLKHGSPEQRTRFLAKIPGAEELWCQGFSEPEAGSDLAAVKTSARLEGEKYVLNGQKVWTSFAQYADWCFVLARTDESVAKHKGLSYFLVKMDSPGLEVRPLKQITGESEFNEIFFDNVEVPKEQLVGGPGQGWEIAISTLMFERVILTLSRHLQSEQALRELVGADKRKLGELFAKNMAVRALAAAHLSDYSDGSSPGSEGSMDKLLWSETFQEICSFALESAPNQLIEGGMAAHRYLYSRGRTIAAGTSEIQRNIIAERVLGLPRK
jgi:alkylation response protein AidB-like acyl-CoA dehydrogenase